MNNPAISEQSIILLQNFLQGILLETNRLNNNKLADLESIDTKLEETIAYNKVKLQDKIEVVESNLEEYKDYNRDLREKFGNYVNDELNHIKIHEDIIEKNLAAAISVNSEADKLREDELKAELATLRKEITNQQAEISELKLYVSNMKTFFEAFKKL